MTAALYNAFLAAHSDRCSSLHRLPSLGPLQLIGGYILGSCPIDIHRSMWSLDRIVYVCGEPLRGLALFKSGQIALSTFSELTILHPDGRLMLTQRSRGTPQGMAIGPDDALYIAIQGGMLPVCKYDKLGERIQYAKNATRYLDPTAIAVDCDGTIILDLNYTYDEYGLMRLSKDGQLIGKCGGRLSNFHHDIICNDRKSIAIHPRTRAIAASTFRTKVALSTAEGHPMKVIDFDEQVKALAFDAAGTLVVGLETKIIIMEIEGEVVRIYQTFGQGELEGVTDVQVTSSGQILIADKNGRITLWQ